MAGRRTNKFALIDDDDTSSAGSTQSGPAMSSAGRGKKRGAKPLPQVTQHLNGNSRDGQPGGGRYAAASSSGPAERAGGEGDPAARTAFIASKFTNPSDAREFEMLKKERDKYDAREMETKRSMTEAAMQGTCPGMCSRFDFLQRIFFDQIDSFERTNGLPDMTKAVKKFQRSSAGNVQHPDDLRTIDALMATTEYLFGLIRANGLDKTYQFVWDRLRAVRRDASTQSLRGPQIIQIYERIVRFHLVCFLVNPTGMNWIQDVDLLNATLTELLYLYTLTPSTPNEFEFRCYDALLYCGDPQRRHRLCEDAAVLTATDPGFASSPTLVALWRATRKVNRLLGISTHSTADAPTQFGAHDFAWCANIMARAPLGVAAVTALHLDRLRRDALFDLVRAKYSIHDRLVTVISIEDVVEKLKFASVDEAITFVEVFEVGIRAETDAAGVDSIVVELDSKEWKDVAVDLKKPAKTKMSPRWFLEKVEGIDLIEFIRTGTASDLVNVVVGQQQQNAGMFPLGAVGAGGFQQQSPFGAGSDGPGAATAAPSFAPSPAMTNGSGSFSSFPPGPPTAFSMPSVPNVGFGFPTAMQQSSPQHHLPPQQRQQQLHQQFPPVCSFNAADSTKQPPPAPTTSAPSPFAFQAPNPTPAQPASTPAPAASFIPPTASTPSGSMAFAPAGTPAPPAFVPYSSSSAPSAAFSFPSAPATDATASICAAAPSTSTASAFTPPQFSAPTPPSNPPAPAPARSPAQFSFGPAATPSPSAPTISAATQHAQTPAPVVIVPPPPRPTPAPPKVMVTAACVQTEDLDLPSTSSSDSEPEDPSSRHVPPPPPPPLETVTLADLASAQQSTVAVHSSSKRSRRLSSSSSATHRHASPARPLIETANKRPRWMGPSPAERAADARAAAFSLQRVQRAVLRTWVANVEVHRVAVAEQVSPQAALFGDASLCPDANKRYRIAGLGTALVDHWHEATWAEVVKGIARWQGVARATYRPWMVVAAGNHAVQCTRDWLGVVAKLVAFATAESRTTRALRVELADVHRAERQVRASVHDLVPTSPIASPETVDARSLCIRLLKSTVLGFVDAQFGEAADEFDDEVGNVVEMVDKVPLYNLTIPFHDVLVPALRLASERVVREQLGGLIRELDERAVLTGEQVEGLRDKIKAVTVEYLTFVYTSMDAVRGHLAAS